MGLVVAGEAAAVHQPAEGPLDDPASWDQLETLHGGVPVDDFDVDAQAGAVVDGFGALAVSVQALVTCGFAVAIWESRWMPPALSETLAAVTTSVPRAVRSPRAGLRHVAMPAGGGDRTGSPPLNITSGSEDPDPACADPIGVVRPGEDGPLVDPRVRLPIPVPEPLDAVVAGRDPGDPRVAGQGHGSGVGETYVIGGVPGLVVRDPRIVARAASDLIDRERVRRSDGGQRGGQTQRSLLRPGPPAWRFASWKFSSVGGWSRIGAASRDKRASRAAPLRVNEVFSVKITSSGG